VSGERWRYDGRRVVVTGCASGIGASLARQLASLGAEVCGGGLVTDERARVLRPDGTVIAGAYAAGNVSAAVMGRSYAGAGATIGPAMTFGYLAVLDIARALRGTAAE
jgi:NAD(P)-dependent dehydrogenase (short-subunit alcohol dehydrogenase family)